MKKKVFLGEDIHRQAYDLLNEYFEIIDDIKYINQVEALLTRNIQIDKKLIDNCTKLEVVAIHGTGYDHVDITYLKQKGITVFHVPGENALSVAEMIVGLIISLSRKICLSDRLLHQQQTVETGSLMFQGNELFHKTIGFIGFGRIARKTALILQNGFKMNVVVYSPHLLKQADQGNDKLCQSVEEVFEKADIVSINCSLNEKTRNLINLDVFKHAKKNCLLINTSRGAIVNENDLYDALTHHIINGAACDVFENEPPHYQHPLLSLDNFIATPHIAATTEEALYRVGMKSVQGIIDYFSGKTIKTQL